MAISSLSRPSPSSCANRAPAAAQASQNVVVKVVNADGSTARTVDSAKQPQEFADLLKKMGLTKEGLLRGEGAKGVKSEGAKGACPKPAESRFQQNWRADSFEPAKPQGKKAQPTPPPTQAQPTPAPAKEQPAPAPAKAQGEKGPPSGKSADAVAKDIAQQATDWTYDYTGGKTWDAAMKNASTFDKTQAGVCVDMAIEAEQRFEKAGVDARVVFGKTGRGDHAWVEFKDDKGEYQAFDPTAAACTKKADDAITPYDNNLYNYGSIFQTHQAVS
ncbi:transglutaminase domain-containing protein [Comamonas sp. JC664]|uniref:transglutaminase domain-containing protein n=1 Tax=Comamonas sp. JC664 TaxID=2801917 RepID=UPI00174D6DBD|nr:transglutaminase domain-containing protein [Comamonas sp. JC664]MBL0694390.1 transglutaminase domain-containing protein [Comamonas sp. JC664]